MVRLEKSCIGKENSIEADCNRGNERHHPTNDGICKEEADCNMPYVTFVTAKVYRNNLDDIVWMYA